MLRDIAGDTGADGVEHVHRKPSGLNFGGIMTGGTAAISAAFATRPVPWREM